MIAWDRLYPAIVARSPAPMAFLAFLATIGSALVLAPTPATVVIALAGLVLLPGGAILALGGIELQPGAPRVIGAGLVGTVAVLAASLVASSVGPLIGIARPLDTEPLRAFLLVVIACLVAAGAITGRDGVRYLVAGFRMRDGGVGALLAIFPIAAVLGGLRLTATGQNDLAMAATTIVVGLIVVTAVAAAVALGRTPVVALLFVTVLAIAYATTSRGSALYGWDIQKELSVALEAADRGRWIPPTDGDAYASMLSITVLPAAFHAVAGIDVETVLRFIFPTYLAGALAAGYLLTRRYTPAAVAFTVLATITFASGSLARGFEAIGREEVALFLTMAAVTLALTGWPGASLRTRRVLLLIGVAGVAVSHYQSAYILVWVLVCAWSIGRLVPLLRREAPPPRTVSVLVIAVAVLLTFGWNIGITNGSDAITRPLEVASEQGIGWLNIPSSIASWVSGSVPQTVPATVLRGTLEGQLSQPSYSWVKPDPRGASVTLVDDTAPTVGGPLAPLAAVWTALAYTVAQALILLTVAAILTAVVMIVRRRRVDSVAAPPTGDLPGSQPQANLQLDAGGFSALDAELLGLGIGALVIVAILRISSLAALGYNPNRGLLHATLLYAPLLAVVLTLVLRRARWASSALMSVLLVVVLLGATGLASAIFGGVPATSLSTVGEDVERFNISAPEYAAVRWLDAVGAKAKSTSPESPSTMLVAADRYGAMILQIVQRNRDFGVLGWTDPAVVDRNAFVFATRANIIDGRARALWGGSWALYRFPRDFYESTRAVVYANDYTRIYR